MRARLEALAVLAAAMILAAPVLAAEPQKGADGKAIFTKHKCGMCHTIESQGILKNGARSDAAPASAGVRRPPDLSNVGAERKVEWMKGWLLKKETIEDRKHLLLFKGTPEELATLTGWLASLKVEKAEKAADKAEKTADKAEKAAEKAEKAAEKSAESAEKAEKAAEKAEKAVEKSEPSSTK